MLVGMLIRVNPGLKNYPRLSWWPLGASLSEETFNFPKSAKPPSEMGGGKSDTRCSKGLKALCTARDWYLWLKFLRGAQLPLQSNRIWTPNSLWLIWKSRSLQQVGRFWFSDPYPDQTPAKIQLLLEANGSSTYLRDLELSSKVENWGCV